MVSKQYTSDIRKEGIYTDEQYISPQMKYIGRRGISTQGQAILFPVFVLYIRLRERTASVQYATIDTFAA